MLRGRVSFSLFQVEHIFFVAESDVPMVGNVFSFVLTKYPPEWRWSLIKVHSSFYQFIFLWIRRIMANETLEDLNIKTVDIRVWSVCNFPVVLVSWLTVYSFIISPYWSVHELAAAFPLHGSTFCNYLVVVPPHHMQSAPQNCVTLHVIIDYHILSKQCFTNMDWNIYCYVDTACSSSTTSGEIYLNHVNQPADILCSVALEKRLVFICLVVNETGPSLEQGCIKLLEK